MTSNNAGQPEVKSEAEESAAERPARQSMGRNVATTLGAQTISWGAALVVVTQLPRYLGPENVGQLRLASSIWLVIIGFVAFGTDKTVTLQVARSEGAVADIVSATIGLRLGLWATAAATACIALLVFEVDAVIATLIIVSGAGAVGTVVGSVGISALQGLENFGALAKVTAAMSVLSPAAILLGIAFDIGLYPIAITLTCIELLTGTLQFRALNKRTNLRWRTSLFAIWNAAKKGFPFLLGGAALVLYREADTVVMAFLVDREQIGWYTTADRLFGTTLIVPTVLMTTMLPVLARVHKEEPERARKMVEETYRTLLLVGLPAGAGLFLLSDPLAVLLFGDQFEGSGPVLGGLGLVLALISVTILLGRYALAIGRERLFYTMLLVASIATVPLDLLFVPYFDSRYDNGAIGGAASFVVTEGAILIVGTALLLPSAVSMATGIRLLKTSLATAAMAAVVYPLRDVFPVVPILAGAVAFGVTVLLLRTLEEHERRIVEPVLNRARAALPATFR